jgi:hypothetical protein
MKYNFIDLTGKRFGRLTVLSLHKSGRHSTWSCICDCGKKVIVRADSLRNGHTQSCGCYNRDVSKITNYRHGVCQSNKHLYLIWKGIKYRCSSKHYKGYNRYGGRGIRLCLEWQNLMNFYNWAIRHGYTEELQIDRIDNDGDYCPENCRWVTAKQNGCNRSDNKRIIFQNRSLTYSEWERQFNLPPGTVSHRINQQNWDAIKAITTPVRKKCKEGQGN